MRDWFTRVYIPHIDIIHQTALLYKQIAEYEARWNKHKTHHSTLSQHTSSQGVDNEIQYIFSFKTTRQFAMQSNH